MPSPQGGLRHVLGGWQTNGIITLQSGGPLTIFSGIDNSLSGIGLTGQTSSENPELSGDRSRGEQILQWFNTSAFAVNAPGTYGSVGRNTLTGPVWLQWIFPHSRDFHFLSRDTAWSFVRSFSICLIVSTWATRHQSFVGRFRPDYKCRRAADNPVWATVCVLAGVQPPFTIEKSGRWEVLSTRPRDAGDQLLLTGTHQPLWHDARAKVR